MTKKQPKTAGTTAAPELEPGDDAIELAISQLDASNTVVKVYRYRDDGTKGFVTQLAPQDNLEHEIARQCGPGKYQLVFYGQRTAKQPAGYRGSVTIHVDAPAVPLVDAAPAPVSSSDRLGAVLEGGAMSVFRAMAEASELNTRVIRQALEPQQRGNPMLEKLIDLAAPIVLPKLLERFLEPRKDERLELLLAELKQQRKPANPLEEIRGALDLVREFQEETADATPPAAPAPVTVNGETVWERLAWRALPLLDVLAAKFTANRPPAPAASAQIPATTSPAAAAAEPVVMPDELGALALFKDHIIEWAEKKMPPAWVAQTLRYQLDPQYHATIVDALRTPVNVNRLLTLVPRLRIHAEWLEQVRVAVVQELGSAAAPPAGTTGNGGAGDTAHGGGDGGDGKGSRKSGKSKRGS